jgi:nucleoside-diphosphate-sugar epimerase
MALTDRSIVITGATGTVGLPVALALAEHNVVWALARFSDDRARSTLEAAGVRCVRGDLAAGDFDGVPRQFDHLLHFARPAEPPDGDFDQAVAGHAEGIGLLMAHCQDAGSVLHCSSTSLYRRGPAPSRETDPLTDDRHPRRPTYTLGKIAAEAVVRTMARVLDLPTVIARLNVPYGSSGGWPATHLEAVAAGTPIPLHERRPNQFNPIHSDDILRTIPALLEVASVPASIVNWAGPDIVSIEDWSGYVGSLIGRTPSFVVSAEATEPMTVDTSKLVTIAGSGFVDWHDGMRRMVEARHPELLS